MARTTIVAVCRKYQAARPPTNLRLRIPERARESKEVGVRPQCSLSAPDATLEQTEGKAQAHETVAEGIVDSAKNG